MCGIAGVLTFEGTADEELRSWVDGQLRAIEHRGRDGTGVHAGGGIALGATRLGIIDLPGGGQPMTSADGRFTLVYNGEVYNFRQLREELEAAGTTFHSRCDTEIVLAAYATRGLACLDDLNGMFAFAVWDRRERELVLCRDRFGIKPLYYHGSERLFAFASEPKAILALPTVPRTIDHESLAVYLGQNYLPPPMTLLREMRSLRPGHALRVAADGRWSEQRWHSLAPMPPLNLAEPELDLRFADLFEAAVARHLISDVPVGVFLSGGLDSTAIAAASCETGEVPKTFTVGFSEAAFDESPHARTVASKLGTDHHELVLGSDAFWQNLQSSASQHDDPVADQAAVAVFALAREARRTVKVCLLGDGGDELLHGYATGQADRLQPWLRLVPGPALDLMRGLVARLGPGQGKLPLSYRVAAFLRGAKLSQEDAHASWRMVHTAETLRALLGPEVPCHDSWMFGPYRAAFAEAPGENFPTRAAHADIQVWLAGNNLPKVDAMTMGANLEGRVPFLDTELSAFLGAIPLRQKLSGRGSKSILRRYLHRKGFPESITRRKKEGFHCPIADWFRGPLGGRLGALIEGGSAFEDGLLRRETARELFEAHARGDADNAFRLFGLALFLLWYEATFKAA